MKQSAIKERCYIRLHNGFTGTISALARYVGCHPSTAGRYISDWNRMTAKEQEKEYQIARLVVGVRDRMEDTDETEPKPAPGFRTPYNTIRSNNISRY